MSRNVVVHIGMMKAASTWFQKVLRQSKTVSTFVPRHFEPGLGRIWHDDAGRPNPKLRAEIRDQMERFLGSSNAKDIVVSNERFLKGEAEASVYFDTLAVVADVLGGLSEPVSVIAFSRAPADWVPSIYQQLVKTNQYSRPFAQFAKARNGVLRGPLSFDRIEQIFCERLGRDRFCWLPSETFRSDPHIGLSWLAERTGVRLELGRSRRNDVNPSIDPVEIEAIRQLNRLKDCYIRSSHADPAEIRKEREQFDAEIRRFIRLAMERRGRRHPALRRVLQPAPDVSMEHGTLADLERLGAAVVDQPHYSPWRERYRRAAFQKA